MRQTDHPVRIAVIDDHPFRRAGLMRLIETWEASGPGAVVGLASTDALLSPEAGHHDLCLVVTGGRSLADRQLQAALRQLRAAEADSAIVVVSDHDATAEARAALDIGLDGYLPTSMEPDVALAALGFILSGGAYFPPRSLEQGGAAGAAAARPPLGEQVEIPQAPPAGPRRDTAAVDARGMPVHLTARQEDVLVFLKSGKSNKEIANALDLSEATVKVHVRQLMKKLGVANRTQVALIAAGPATPRGIAGSLREMAKGR